VRYFFAVLLLLLWLLLAPWVAKGYGDWYVPNPLADHPLDVAVFYFLPVSAIAIAYSTYRLKRAK
jgi:hypothetical protein